MKISHWSPQYLAARVREKIYQARNPDAPWLNKQANEFLNAYLRKSDIGFEIGSGRSTAWIAQRVMKLTSIEGHSGWHAKVSKTLSEREIYNVDYRLVDESKQSFDELKKECVRILHAIPEPLDFGLSDGLCRGLMAIHLTEKVKPGGLVIVDDAHWFIPSTSKTLGARSLEQPPRNDDQTGEWERFCKLVKGWRTLWTTNGVTDTAVFFKPS